MLLGDERRELCEAGRQTAESGLVIGAAGNLSVRSGDLVAISPSGVELDRLTPEGIPVIDMEGRVVAAEGDVVAEGGGAPSSETPMHLAIYATTDAAAIVHTHSTYGAVVAATMAELPPIHYYTLLLGGVVRVADYAAYGTPELAGSVRTALAGRRAALMANHGGVAIGGTLAEAYENARLLEWLCGVYVRAKTIGEPRLLTEAELGELTERGFGPPALPPR
ncbi:class II aldolase/adducin family protein [Actinomadura alba]|uniref:Class II aldolase/adducin family protein n=1 Tax=Actinomadura alba TaxID=406431 RepID=A0ABR7LXZ9_9ACTN|nr:class II aldolase/adducin family protein [Actinomadura alba]MBC6469635.1 class II aldolase/adducin family protein [Actinomadura alba]